MCFHSVNHCIVLVVFLFGCYLLEKIIFNYASVSFSFLRDDCCFDISYEIRMCSATVPRVSCANKV